jgi:molybdopterin/thiamine biosynthesis adenylyltransferase
MEQPTSLSRIAHLVEPEILKEKCVVVVGLGSGGYPSVQNLAMFGVAHWILFDRDTLDAENLEKHPGLRSDIGRMKTEIAKEWILDRNPNAQVECVNLDITVEEGRLELERAIGKADAVLCCTDNKNSRLQTNRMCLQLQVPCVTGVVYRTGFGGDAFLYDPGRTACFDCFLSQASNVSLERMMDSSKTTASKEQLLAKARYGREIDPKYGLSGLSIDIQFISLLMARMLLPVLMEAETNLESLLIDDCSNLEQKENHFLRMPYHIRGPNQPLPQSQNTIWLNTGNGKRYVFLIEKKCPECGESFTPEKDRFCSWCGFAVHELAQEHHEGKEDVWQEITPPSNGYGYNHISLITRRYLIDELKKTPSGNESTGNICVSLEPLTLTKNYIKADKNCLWCQDVEEAS